MKAINLNLLLAFDALASERNVTRAARTMGLTQSGLSNALAQLRVVLGDPLFVRGPGGVVPTERALELAPFVRKALATLEEGLKGTTAFDPKTSERSFTIVTNDYLEYVVVPRVLHVLERKAPGVRLTLIGSTTQAIPRALEEGTADAMMGFYDVLPSGHHQATLFETDYVCIVRRDHPRTGKKLDLDRYCELRHVLVTDRPDALGTVDHALARIGRKRTIGARVSHFLMAPRLVSQTDLIAAVDRHVAEAFAVPLRLRLVEPPLALPKGRLRLAWHARVHADPANAWLREIILGIAKEVA